MNEKSVRVFCRFRPLNCTEIVNGSKKVVRIDDSTTVNVQSETKADSNFEFDFIFPEDIQQEKVYEMVGKPLVEEVLKGYNASVFAYGQTGCLDPDTRVVMFDGSLKKAKDVDLGDLLMGDDSTPRKVLRLYAGKDEMYTITPSKGTPYKVNSSHILTVCKYNLPQIYWNQKERRYEVHWLENGVAKKYRNQIRGNNEDSYQRAVKFYDSLSTEEYKLIDIPVAEYINFSQAKQNEYLGIRTGVKFPHKDIPIDPYLLGLWLGNGNKDASEINNVDPEIVGYMWNEAKKVGLDLIQTRDNTYRLNNYDHLYEKGPSQFYSFLKVNNLLNNKHIPTLYKINSKYVRLRLLAGLVDSNCHLRDSSNYEFTQKSEQFMEDFLYLCQSLGFSCYKTKITTFKGKKRSGAYYRCIISGKGLDQIPVLIKCKKITGFSYKHDLGTIIRITPSGKGEYNGWTLDGNGRFLLSDFTITHNSGKTTTMSGYSHSVDNTNPLAQDNIILWENPNDMGVVPRFIQDIFTSIKIKKDYEFSIQVSYVEIYLEKIRDLLNPINDNLEIRESRYRGVWIEDITEVYVSSFEEAIKVIRKGELNRTVAATAMNAQSSRSHSILNINLTQTNTKTQDKTTSRMVFVDLAGSEKAEKTKVDGLMMKQAQATNKSLLTLGIVIRALVEKKAHIPYRDSKLTRLLTDSLGGNSKTHLILACSPALYNVEETISTLRFGNIAQQIKNKPRVNLEVSIEEYKRQLLQANKKMATQQTIIESIQKDLHKLINLCEKEKIDVKFFVKDYAISTAEKKNNESYTESSENFNRLNSEIESKASIITELQQIISTLRDDIEKVKDDTELLRDDLDHRCQDLEIKTLEVEVLTTKNSELTRMHDNLHKQLQEQAERIVQRDNEVKLDQSMILSENTTLKQRVSQLVEENQNLRESSLRAWKDDTPTEENRSTVERYPSILGSDNELKQLLRSDEESKQLLESKARHIKVLEEYLQANGTKIQELVGDHKRRCIEYDKKIKDLETEVCILRTPTPSANIFTPLKY